MEKAAYRPQKVNLNCDNLFSLLWLETNEPKRLRAGGGTHLLQALEHLGHVGLLALVGLEGEIHRDAVQRYLGHVFPHVPARKRRPAVYPAATPRRGCTAGVTKSDRPESGQVRLHNGIPKSPHFASYFGTGAHGSPGRRLTGTRGPARAWPRTSRLLQYARARLPRTPGPLRPAFLTPHPAFPGPSAARARLPGLPGPWRQLPWERGQRGGGSPSPPVQNPRACVTCHHPPPSRAVRNFRPALPRELRRCLGNRGGEVAVG